MGCNCKQAKRVEKNMPSVVMPNYKKSGLRKFGDEILKFLWKLLGHCIVVIFTILLIPVLIVVGIISYFKHGEMIISLPFIGRKSSQYYKELKTVDTIK
jgi:hypothetical protein